MAGPAQTAQAGRRGSIRHKDSKNQLPGRLPPAKLPLENESKIQFSWLAGLPGPPGRGFLWKQGSGSPSLTPGTTGPECGERDSMGDLRSRTMTSAATLTCASRGPVWDQLSVWRECCTVADENQQQDTVRTPSLGEQGREIIAIRKHLT